MSIMYFELCQDKCAKTSVPLSMFMPCLSPNVYIFGNISYACAFLDKFIFITNMRGLLLPASELLEPHSSEFHRAWSLSHEACIVCSILNVCAQFMIAIKLDSQRL